jgi:hypothetical protein
MFLFALTNIPKKSSAYLTMVLISRNLLHQKIKCKKDIEII